MENKQKNFSPLFICFIFLITFSKYSNVEGAFIGQQTISNGLSPPNEPNYPFYHDNLLHLLIGVKNAPVGAEASLAQYNSGGSILKNISLPLPCLQECTIEGAVFGLVNNSAFVSLRRSDAHYDWACMIYQIDLSSFQIVNSSDILNGVSPYSHYCSYSLPVFSPYNSTHCVYTTQWFEYSTLSIIPDVYNYINPANQIGGSSSALSDENLIIYQDMDGYNENLVSQNVATYNYQTIHYFATSMIVFLGDNSTHVAVTTGNYAQGYNLTILNAANLFLTSSEFLIRNYLQTGMLADSSNNLFYIGNTPSQGVLIHQFKVNVESNSHSLLDKLTLVNFQSPPFYPAFFSILSWGLNEPTQQFAIVIKDMNTDSFLLQLIDYDNN